MGEKPPRGSKLKSFQDLDGLRDRIAANVSNGQEEQSGGSGGPTLWEKNPKPNLSPEDEAALVERLGGIPSMITKGMRKDLSKKGYTDAEVAHMKPIEAAFLLQPKEAPQTKSVAVETIAEAPKNEEDSALLESLRESAKQKILQFENRIATPKKSIANNPEWKKAWGAYELFTKSLESSPKSAQSQFDILTRQLEEQSTAMPLETLRSEPKEVLVTDKPIDREAEKTKLKEAVARLEGIDDPHDSWNPKKFLEYEKKRKENELTGVDDPHDFWNPEEFTAHGNRPKGVVEPAPIAPENAGESEEALKIIRGWLHQEPMPTEPVSVPHSPGPGNQPLGEAGWKGIPKEDKNGPIENNKKAGEFPPPVLVKSWVPEGVKTNKQLKEEFLANKGGETVAKEPAEKQYRTMAEYMVDKGIGREIHRKIAAEAIAARGDALDAEATSKFGEGSKEAGFLKRNTEKFNKMPHKKKILAGVALLALLGALALRQPEVVSGFEYALRTVQETGQSAWQGIGHWVQSLTGHGAEQHAAGAAKVVEHAQDAHQGMSAAERALVEQAQHASKAPITSAELETIRLNQADIGNFSAEVLSTQGISPEHLQEFIRNAPAMQVDPNLVGGVGEGAHPATPYLLHDGHVAIFGGSGTSDTELFNVQKEAAQHFASQMNVDVVIRPEAYGAPGGVIVHPDGSTSQIFSGTMASGPHPEDAVMKLVK